MTNKKYFDLSELKPIIENEIYAIYTLGQINDNLWKAVRYNKQTKEQVEVTIEKEPKVRVVQVFYKTRSR